MMVSLVFPSEPSVAPPIRRNGAQCARARWCCAAKRTLAREHRSGKFLVAMDGSDRNTMFPLVSSESGFTVSALCLAAQVPALWRRTRPPLAVSGSTRRFRRLSLCLPASLETRTWGHREFVSLAQSPDCKAWQVAPAVYLRYSNSVVECFMPPPWLPAQKLFLCDLLPSGKLPIFARLLVLPGYDF